MITNADIIQRLATLDYTDPTNGDFAIISFELNKTCNYVLNYCNIITIPEILYPRIIDKVCYEFLYRKKNLGDLPDFNYDTVIKSIKEGDTQIQYAVGQGEDTPEHRFDSYIKSLERGFDKWLTPHRRIRW